MGPGFIKLVGAFPTVVDMNPGIRTNNGNLQPYLRGVDIIKAVVSVLVPPGNLFLFVKRGRRAYRRMRFDIARGFSCNV